MDRLPDEVVAEAERLAGARFTRVERVARGYSRASFRAEDEAGKRYAIRVATADGPSTGTELTLDREAAFYAALASSAVRLPALYGTSADGSFLVAEWAPGRPGVGHLSASERDAIYLDYIDALAELHAVDAAQVAVPGADARDPHAGARHELARWRRVLAAKVARPRPLAWFALAYLERSGLPAAQRSGVCHGDPGPGNFLHDGTHVTALLDWEFAHVGDPVDDLAWWAFRGHHLTGECGDLSVQLERWSARTGCEVPPATFAFYEALTAVRFYISLVVMLESAGGAVDRALPLRVTAQVAAALPPLLAAVSGRALPEYEIPPGQVPAAGGDAVRILRTTIGDVALPAADDGEVRRRLRASLGLLEHLEACLALGHEADRQHRAELAHLLGRPVENVAEGERALCALVDDPAHHDDLLDHFWRAGRRGEGLWTDPAPRSEEPA
jgi:aminoglycoside phosphotransferase (APT) family kinase protein